MTPDAQNPYSRAVDDAVVYWSREGLTVRQIAQRIGITFYAAKNRVTRLRQRGVIPPLEECRYGANPPPAAPAQNPPRLGTMAQVWRRLTDEERTAVLDMTPQGATVADLLASVLRDIIAEEVK